MFSLVQAEDLLKRQHSVNRSLAGEDYLDKVSTGITEGTIDFDMAATDELIELAKSLSYEWWKPTSINIRNAQVELIDAMHFMLSGLLASCYHERIRLMCIDMSDITQDERDSLFQWMMEDAQETLVEANCFTSLADDSHVLDRNKLNNHDALGLVRNLIHLVTKDSRDWRECFDVFLTIAERLGLEADTLYSMYIVKSLLNKFRRANGYRDGTYIKQWRSTEATDEDNEDNAVLFDLVLLKPNLSEPQLLDLIHSLYEVVREDASAAKTKLGLAKALFP